MKKDSLGDRMKNYEKVSNHSLLKNTPVIIRIDGWAFHTFTKGFDKPVDEILFQSMGITLYELCRNITGCKFGYMQSDEISLLLTDYDRIETQAWFDNRQSKLESISASLATLYFNRTFVEIIKHFTNERRYIDKLNTATFYARAFNLPKEEVVNYFIWRQQDAIRNSLQAYSQANFNHKELIGKNTEDMKKMLSEKGIDWDKEAIYKQRGLFCYKDDTPCLDEKEGWMSEGHWRNDLKSPLFIKDREYIEKFIFPKVNQ